MGDLLLTSAVNKDEIKLPSPSALRHKIILKHKKLQLESDAVSAPASSAASAASLDDDESEIFSRDCVKKGVLSLNNNNGDWTRHLFVLFPDRLCYTTEPIRETDGLSGAGIVVEDGDGTSQGGEEDDVSLSGRGVGVSSVS